MPPRIRGNKTTKLLKENIGVGNKTKLKSVSHATRSKRKALTDKTNSESDDNASSVYPKKIKKPIVILKPKLADDLETSNNGRSRRERRLPNRYAESEVLKNLSKSQNYSPVIMVPSNQKGSPLENYVTTEVSPFKTLQKRQRKSPEKLETSLETKRSKRVCRLPSKFDDHSISPSKFVPVQPFCASTPIAQKMASKSKTSTIPVKKQTTVAKKSVRTRRMASHSPIKGVSAKKQLVQTSITDKFSEQKNKNAQKRAKTTNKVAVNQNNTQSLEPLKEKQSLSFRNLGTKRTIQNTNESDMDVYEFTFDPTEEPKLQKKKRKRVVKKKPAQPKSVVYNSVYDKNISKALSALKSFVSKKPVSATAKDASAKPVTPEKPIPTESQVKPTTKAAVPVSNNNVSLEKPFVNTTVNNVVHNHQSVRIEDIAANLEPSDHHDIDYSPVNSPNHQNNSVIPENIAANKNTNDALNLREESFFDEPIASSSMNISVRRTDASPWRANFNELPIKWMVNSYVKPNMTPAVECSYINSSDNLMKHVYTNMVEEAHDSLPQIVDSTPDLKQTSIISFFKEVVERSAKKRRRSVSVTPTKTSSNSLTERQITPVKMSDNKKNTSETTGSSSNEANMGGSRMRKNISDENNVPAINPCKEKDEKFFGFDESEDFDQENVPPRKNIDKNRLKSLRPRAKAVLKEINKQTGPMRAEIPLAVKRKLNSEVINKVYDELKTASHAPTFPESNMERDNVSPSFTEEMDDESQSVHLFEDIEIVHHLKPIRKSYGKSNKVTFRQRERSTSESDASASDAPEQAESEVEDLSDLSFQVPNVKQKKPGKKKKNKKLKLTKKEKQEADAWAAGFNSMCEDVDEFDLIVE